MSLLPSSVSVRDVGKSTCQDVFSAHISISRLPALAPPLCPSPIHTQTAASAARTCIPSAVAGESSK